MTRQLIALHGAQGAGKDAVAEILVRDHGFTRFAFADRLKQMCEALDPVVTYRLDQQLITALMEGEQPSLRPVRLGEIVGQVGWDRAKRDYPEVRRTQQYLATEVIRDFVSDTFWADEVDRDVRGCQKAVITDLRFETEYDMVQRHQGVVWWVHRPGNPNSQANLGHRSEVWHPPAYRKIDNTGTLDDLADTVIEKLRFWKTQIPHEKYEAGLV